MLFRPITVDLTQSGYLHTDSTAGHSILKQAFAIGCVNSCITAAQDIIDVIAAGRVSGQLPVWWYSVFYLYTAGTVLLAVLLTPALRQARPNKTPSLNASWEVCIDALSRFADSDESFAKSCVLLLQSALDHALSEIRTNSRHKKLHADHRSPICEANVQASQTRNQSVPDEGLSSQDVDPRTTDLELLSSEYFDLSNTPLTTTTFLESWWPTDGIEWLNSIPTEFSSNTLYFPNFQDHLKQNDI